MDVLGHVCSSIYVRLYALLSGQNAFPDAARAVYHGWRGNMQEFSSPGYEWCTLSPKAKGVVEGAWAGKNSKR